MLHVFRHSIANKKQPRSSWGNSTKPEVFIISSKDTDLGSQPEVKTATLFLTT